MCRPGYTDTVLEGMRGSGVLEGGPNLVLGPELEDISSSDARTSLSEFEKRNARVKYVFYET